MVLMYTATLRKSLQKVGRRLVGKKQKPTHSHHSTELQGLGGHLLKQSIINSSRRNTKGLIFGILSWLKKL